MDTITGSAIRAGLILSLLTLCTACGEPPALEEAATAVATSADSPVDSLALERQRYIDQILEEIAGQEDEPAGEVFEDVRMRKDRPARRLLAVMDMAYSQSLGVSCTHCHNPDNWGESTREKTITRGMSAMMRQINTELLASIDDLGDGGEQPPVVNCTTCHRGEVKPALDLSEAPHPTQ